MTAITQPDPNDMRETLRIKSVKNNKARMIVEYCYEWISEKNISTFCIIRNYRQMRF